MTIMLPMDGVHISTCVTLLINKMYRMSRKRSRSLRRKNVKGGEITDITKLLKEVFKLKKEYEMSCNNGVPVKLDRFGEGGSEESWNLRKKNLKKALCECQHTHCESTPFRFTRDYRSAR